MERTASLQPERTAFPLTVKDLLLSGSADSVSTERGGERERGREGGEREGEGGKESERGGEEEGEKGEGEREGEGERGGGEEGREGEGEKGGKGKERERERGEEGGERGRGEGEQERGGGGRERASGHLSQYQSVCSLQKVHQSSKCQNMSEYQTWVQIVFVWDSNTFLCSVDLAWCTLACREEQMWWSSHIRDHLHCYTRQA